MQEDKSETEPPACPLCSFDHSEKYSPERDFFNFSPGAARKAALDPTLRLLVTALGFFALLLGFFALDGDSSRFQRAPLAGVCWTIAATLLLGALRGSLFEEKDMVRAKDVKESPFLSLVYLAFVAFGFLWRWLILTVIAFFIA